MWKSYTNLDEIIALCLVIIRSWPGGAFYIKNSTFRIIDSNVLQFPEHWPIFLELFISFTYKNISFRSHQGSITNIMKCMRMPLHNESKTKKTEEGKCKHETAGLVFSSRLGCCSRSRILKSLCRDSYKQAQPKAFPRKMHCFNRKT